MKPSLRAKFTFLKENKKQIKILLTAIFLLQLIFLLGCTEMSRAEKNLCYSLSSKSYSYIPVCETENSCFEKVNLLFKTDLGYQQESNFYELKNNVARSWFFYNKSLIEAKNISKICQRGDYLELAGAINQTKANIDTSFLELDAALEKSFEIISYEEKSLSEDKIDLVKEEAIYESLIELRQILSELSSGETNSDSYVAYYKKKVAEFNNSNAKKLPDPLVEEIPFWIQNYAYLDGTILKELGLSTELAFPFLSYGLVKAMDYMEARFYTTQGLRELQNFPLSGFILLYSNLGGNSNSSLKRFADLMNRVSINKKTAQKTAEDLTTQIEKELSLCEELAQKAKDNKKYETLAQELTLPSITSTEDAKTLLISQTKDYLTIKENYAKGKLKLGEKLLQLKEALNNFIQIKKQFEWENNEINQKLKSACEEKAIGIRKEQLSSTNPNLQLLIEETVYYATKIQDSNEKKLDYCFEMTEKYKLLQEGLNEYLELEAKQKDSSLDCVFYLESVFPQTTLNELKLMFENLKKQEITKENLILFEQNCLSIKEQVDNELNSEKNAKELLEKYKNLQFLIENLKKEQVYFKDGELDKTIVELQNKLISYEKYFQNGSINFSEALPVEKVLLEALTTSIEKANTLLMEKIIEYAKRNAQLNCITNQIVEIDKTYLCNTNLVIPNPFFEITKQFSLDFNLKLKEIINKSPCFSEINQIDSNSLKINFNCLKHGSNLATFLTEEKITTSEKEEFIYISNEESLIKKNILLSNSLTLQKILIKTPSLPQTTNSIVIVNDQELQSYFDEKQNVSFLLEEASNKTNIFVYLYVKNIINTTITYVSSNSNLIEYSFKAQNNLTKDLTADLSINLPSNKFVEKIEILDNTYTTKKHELFNDKIILKNQAFLAKENKTYKVLIYTNSELEYYLEELKNQKDKFLLLGETTLANNLNQTILAGEKNTISQLRKLVEENLIKIIQLETNKQKDESIEFMKQKILKKIEELRKSTSELALLGLEKQAIECESLVNKVLSLDLTNENNIAKAFDLLSTAIFSTDEGIKKGVEDLTIKLDLIKGYENNFEFNTLKDSFLKLKQSIFETISFDPALAKKDFLNLNKKYEEILLLKSQLDKNSQDYSNKLKKEVEKIYLVSKELTLELEQNLFSNENTLIQSKILAPITQSRLKKLNLLLDEINNSTKPLEQKLSEIEDIYNELTRANEVLEKQAIAAYNAGIDSGLEKDVLYKGKAFIDENKYVDALLLLSSKNQPKSLMFGNVPFASFIPIIIIILLAFVIKQAFGKKEKEENTKKNLILEEWKD
ncbi:MAG: hypothetical protein WC821_02245 [archaeon]|jgi:hypothetical protein